MGRFDSIDIQVRYLVLARLNSPVQDRGFYTLLESLCTGAAGSENTALSRSSPTSTRQSGEPSGLS